MRIAGHRSAERNLIAGREGVAVDGDGDADALTGGILVAAKVEVGLVGPRGADGCNQERQAECRKNSHSSLHG